MALILGLSGLLFGIINITYSTAYFLIRVIMRTVKQIERNIEQNTVKKAKFKSELAILTSKGKDLKDELKSAKSALKK